MFCGGDIPPVASRVSMFDFNEPYTTVSLALAAMAASSAAVPRLVTEVRLADFAQS